MSLIPRGSLVLTPELPDLQTVLAEALAHTRGHLRRIADRGRKPRLLLINTGHFGDQLVGLPAMLQARKAHPHAHIAALVARPADILFRRGGWFDELIVMPSYALKANQPGNLKGSLSALWKVISSDWDMVVSFAPDPEDRFIASLSRAPIRVGPVKLHNWNYSRGWTTTTLPWEQLPMRVAARFACVSRASGFGDPEDPPVPLRDLPLTAEESAAVQDFLRDLPGDGPLVTLVVCGSKGWRRWPIEKHAEVAAHVKSVWGGRCVIVTGPGEQDAVEEVKSRLVETGLAKHFESRPLLHLLGLMRRSAAVVASDSGPAHLAAACGAKTVYMVAEFMAEGWLPHGPHVRGVSGEGVRDIPVEAVIAQLRSLLQRRKPMVIGAAQERE